MTPEPSEPSVPSKLDVSENVESVASDEELLAATGMSPDISNQAADRVAAE